MGGAAPGLYNLAQDIGEKNNLAAANPERVKELRAAYAAWNAQLVPPKWQGRVRTGAPKGRGKRKKG